MSIPGLGQIIPQASTTTQPTSERLITLKPGGEWRFSIPHHLSSAGITSSVGGVSEQPGDIKVRLINGSAERDGTSLSLNRTYVFGRTKSKISTWEGCTLRVEGGPCDQESVFDPPGGLEGNPSMVAGLNLHFMLQRQREAVATATMGDNRSNSINKRQQQQGPRVMVCGEAGSGKTTLARTLAGLATRMGEQPLVANLDPGEGLQTLPGTVSAGVYGTIMDVEDPAGGFGVRNTPSTGPSEVPVKLPIVYYFGREKVEDDVPLWKDLAGKLASSVRAKFKAIDEVRSTGLILDTPGVKADSAGMEVLSHAVGEFAINTIIVIGSAELEARLYQRFAQEKTPLGEPITILRLDKSSGVARRDKAWIKADSEAAIREYFFGDARRTLSPITLSVSYDEMAIFRALDESESYDAEESQQQVLEPAEVSSEMSHWTLAVMDATVNDPPETIRLAPVMGFIAIASVDEDRRRLKFLSPVGGKLGNKPLIWGQWPEPYLNLLG